MLSFLRSDSSLEQSLYNLWIGGIAACNNICSITTSTQGVLTLLTLSEVGKTSLMLLKSSLLTRFSHNWSLCSGLSLGLVVVEHLLNHEWLNFAVDLGKRSGWLSEHDSGLGRCNWLFRLELLSCLSTISRVVLISGCEDGLFLGSDVFSSLDNAVLWLDWLEKFWLFGSDSRSLGQDAVFVLSFLRCGFVLNLLSLLGLDLNCDGLNAITIDLTNCGDLLL